MDSETTAQNHTAIDLSGLVFCVCPNQEEFAQLLKCRWRGYKKYGFASPDECRDEFDERAIHYLCKDDISNEVLGCLRMLSKFNGKLELESFVTISDWATNGVHPAELTRFSVPISKRSTAIKFGLWKLAWLDAVRRGHTHFVIWTRKEARRNYNMLGFDFLLGKENFLGIQCSVDIRTWSWLWTLSMHGTNTEKDALCFIISSVRHTIRTSF